jgi:hypothetical protein
VPNTTPGLGMLLCAHIVVAIMIVVTIVTSNTVFSLQWFSMAVSN